MTSLAIKVENLSKEYVLGCEVSQNRTFREMLMGAVKEPINRLKRLQGSSKQQERFRALKDVNFTVNEGEVVGIIGANGAGKSTLLKVLSRITAPTKGQIQYRGNIASLLEVGTGFHPELSGRENIFINGAILGMTKAEITKRFDDIVDFSGVEKFLDTPVKRYSSGMHVRLAFAVAAHMDPDILVVDEVLAVGDVTFQKKCIGKMKDVAVGGRTVLFVSHNMGMISKLCTRGLMLDEGSIFFDGTVSETVQCYYHHVMGSTSIPAQEFSGTMKSEVIFTEIRINGGNKRADRVISPKDAIEIEVSGTARVNIKDYRTTISISKEGEHLVSVHDSIQPYLLEKGDFIAEITFSKFFLGPGNYSIEVAGYSLLSGAWVWAKNIAQFSVANEWFINYDTNSNMGMINLPNSGTHRSLL